MSDRPIKILMHLHRPPIPVDGGDKQRLMGILNYFSDRRDSLIVDGFGGNTPGKIEWQEQDIVQIAPYFRNFWVYQGQKDLFDFVYSRSQSFYYQKILWRQLPIDTDYFAPPNYVRFVKQIVTADDYDYLWLNYLEYAALGINLSKDLPIKILIDIHDLACQGRLAITEIDYLQKLKFDYDRNLIKELKLLSKFNKIIVNSLAEIDVLKASIPGSKLALIPHLLPIKQSNPTISYQSRKFAYDLLFVGTGRIPNLNAMNFFLQDIFPQVIAQKPDVVLALVGSIAKALNIPAKFSANIICLDYVPDLSKVYLSSRLVICPLLQGAGTKVKLQEALAYALPIVTTTVGASGLRLNNSQNAYISDLSSEFATSILKLLNNEKLCQEFSLAAAQTFQEHYSTARIYSELDKLFTEH